MYAYRRVIEERHRNQKQVGVQRGFACFGETQVDQHPQRKDREERNPAHLKKVVARPGRRIHVVVAVMQLVNGPQGWNAMLQAMSPIIPKDVQQQGDKNHRDELKRRADEGNGAYVMEGNREGLPGKMLSKLRAPKASRDAERQDENGARQGDQNIVAVIAV